MKTHQIVNKSQQHLLDQLAKCNDPIIQNLADELHYDNCFENHTDRCGYGYGAWNLDDDPPVNNVLMYAEERIENYKKIEKLYTKFGLEKFNIYMTIKKEFQKLNEEE
jgi:hypothetical protein